MIFYCTDVARQSESCRPVGWHCFCPFKLYVLTKNKHPIKAIALSKIRHKHYLLCIKEHHHVLACLKQWSCIKTQLQLPNDQIRSTWCIATRGNVSKAWILMVFDMIWNWWEHFENKAGNLWCHVYESSCYWYSNTTVYVWLFFFTWYINSMKHYALCTNDGPVLGHLVLFITMVNQFWEYWCYLKY